MLFCKFEGLQITNLNVFYSIANFKIWYTYKDDMLHQPDWKFQLTWKQKAYQFPISFKRDCRKNCLMRRYSTQLNVNTMMPWRNVGSKLILNTSKFNDKNEKIDLEILLFGLSHLSKSSIHKWCKYFSSIDQYTFSKVS